MGQRTFLFSVCIQRQHQESNKSQPVACSRIARSQPAIKSVPDQGAKVLVSLYTHCLCTCRVVRILGYSLATDLKSNPRLQGNAPELQGVLG